MKDNFIHVCFVIDESGSMYSSVDDVKGGFKKIIEEQKENKEGKCAISMYTFGSDVRKLFIGKDVSEIGELDYSPSGMTALNDGVGRAIDEVGQWLASMDESERPSSNLIVIMTDGGENFSKEYSISRVRDMINHQTEKYNWTFMYMGADITTSEIADSLGIKYRGYSTKASLGNSYDTLNTAMNNVRYNRMSLDAATRGVTMDMCQTFKQESGIDLKNEGD